MKKLLVISFLFFSIGAIAEDKYRCEYFKYCENFGFNCSTRVIESYTSLVIDEGWFSKKVYMNGTDLSWGAAFEEYEITFGYPGDDSISYQFDKTSLVLETTYKLDTEWDSKLKPGTKIKRFSEYKLCRKVN